LIFLSLAYGGMTFQQPNIFAVCSETGGHYLAVQHKAFESVWSDHGSLT